MFDPYTMVGIFGIGAYPFCFNIRMVSSAIFWAVLVLVPVGVNMVLKPFGTDKKTIIGPAIGILALVMFLSGVAVEKYSHYMCENYGTVHEADYSDYEVVKPDIAVKLLKYPHKPWFQRFLKTEATFRGCYDGVRYSQVEFWRLYMAGFRSDRIQRNRKTRTRMIFSNRTE